MKRRFGFLFISAILYSNFAMAADLNSVYPGDVYYLWKIDGPNQRVTVRQVDYENSRIKVALSSGEIKWVSASDLKTKEEAAGDDVALGLGLLAGVLIYCALDSEGCDSASGRPAPAAPLSNPAAIAEFKFTNNCRHPVRVAIQYKNTQGNWVTEGWWSVSAFSSTYLADASNARLRTTAAGWYYYAETTNNSGLVWKGAHGKSLGGVSLPMIEMMDKEGDSEWTLVCDGM